MIELNEKQRLELNESEPSALDPRTRQVYILVRKEAFERIKSLLTMDDYNPDEGMALVNEAMAQDDTGDPLLESYQHFGKKA